MNGVNGLLEDAMAEIENVAACARHRVEHSLGRVDSPARQQPARIEVALNRANGSAAADARSSAKSTCSVTSGADRQRLSGMGARRGTESPEHPHLTIRAVTAASGPADQSTAPVRPESPPSCQTP